MKKTLFLTAALISLASSVKAAPCTVFITTQDTAAANELIIDEAYTTSGVDFSSATTIKAQAGQVLVDNRPPEIASEPHTTRILGSAIEL